MRKKNKHTKRQEFSSNQILIDSDFLRFGLIFFSLSVVIVPFCVCIDDVTVAICPGIGNTSETVYIRTFVNTALNCGYRCAVLNHIGALNSVEVTSSRIFSYGK